ncbi:MAG: hypothetical protein IT343_18655 [Candidatus Melainabacteria bacterium]|nr:hypothetical protein [Candidatus Melainabacteria bacterium]
MVLRNKITALAIAAVSASCLSAQPSAAQDGGLEGFFSPVQKMIAPEFKNEKERVEYVLKVMQRVQSAALRYASHHKGELPKKVDNAFMSYMIFGECDDKTYNSFSVPLNPYTGKRNQILIGKIADPEKCRKSPPGKMSPGSVEYSLAAGGKNFTVRGGVGTGKAMADPKNKRQTYVLSRDPSAQVKANMRTVQWAAELYKEEHHGFPKAVDDEFKYFFPWGDPLKKKLGFALPNPYTGKLEYPVLGKMKSPTTERLKAPAPLPAGVIEYCSTDAQTNYCVRGGDANGKAIQGMSGPKSTMILAKDGDGTGHGNDSR